MGVSLCVCICVCVRACVRVFDLNNSSITKRYLINNSDINIKRKVYYNIIFKMISIEILNVKVNIFATFSFMY